MISINVLKARAASKKVGKGLSSFWAVQNENSRYFDPSFPKKIRCGMRSVGWIEQELDEWIARQAAQRNSQAEGVCHG